MFLVKVEVDPVVFIVDNVDCVVVLTGKKKVIGVKIQIYTNKKRYIYRRTSIIKIPEKSNRNLG